MQQLVLSIINGIIFSFFAYFGGRIIYNKKGINIYRVLIAFVIYIISFVINIYNFTPLFTVFFYYISIVIFEKIAFNSSLSKTLLVSLIIYVSRMIVEIILIVLNVFHPKVIYAVNALVLEKFLSNILSAIISLIIFLLLKKIIIKFIKNIENHQNNSFIIFSLIYFNLTLVFMIRMPYLERNFNLVYDIIIILLMSIITMVIINQEHKMNMMSRMYNEIANYAKLSDKLIEEYRVSLHERKNELIIINNMLNKNKKDAKNYVESLINEKESITSEWLNELNNIPIFGLRGFINFKIIEMKNSGIKPEILISPAIADIKKLKFEDVKDLYTMIGVFLDNSIEASKESFDKMVSIQMYEENDEVHIVIANSFKGDIDLERINVIGYTTKGTGRGTGLAIVDNITKNSSIYKLNTSIFKNFFVQDLTISI